MKQTKFDVYFKTIDFGCLSVSKMPRRNAAGNIVRVKVNKQIELPERMKGRQDLIKSLQKYPFIEPSVVFYVDHWSNGFRLTFSFNNTIMGKRYVTNHHNQSGKIVKEFDDQVCFMAICMALFIAFSTEHVSSDSICNITSIKKMPSWRSVVLPKEYWEIHDAIKQEFPLALDQLVVQSLGKLHEEFKVLHKYNIPFERVVQAWKESLVKDVMEG